MTLNIAELGHRRHPETLLHRTLGTIGGEAAFIALYHDAMSRIDPSRQPLLQEPETLAAAHNAAVAFVAAIPGSRFVDTFREIQGRLPLIAETITDPDRVERILDDQHPDSVEFLIATASLENPTPMIEAMTDPSTYISEEEAVEFRNQLLTFNDGNALEIDCTEKFALESEGKTLTEIVTEALDRIEASGISQSAPFGVVLSLFPELRSDLTQNKRTRGKDGRMEISRDSLIALVVRKNSKGLQFPAKTVERSVHLEHKVREAKTKQRSMRGGE